MLATRDKAAKKFAEFVKIANGDAYLVYLALSSAENPTEEEVKEYILKNMGDAVSREDTIIDMTHNVDMRHNAYDIARAAIERLIEEGILK